MLINLRNALMAGKRLPYDAEVEYLESTGTQYIDTGIVGNERLIIDSTWSYSASDASAQPFGSRMSASSRALAVTGWSATIDYRLYLNYGSKDSYIHYDGAGLYEHIWEIHIENGNSRLIRDGLVVSTGSASTTAFTTPTSLILFGGYSNGSIKRSKNVRIYSWSVREGNALVRDYIPVRKGTVGYLYDRVSGKLFGNAGTGDFVLGPDVVPVEYIESHGMEYIDTGVKGAGSGYLATTFQPLDVGSSSTYWRYFGASNGSLRTDRTIAYNSRGSTIFENGYGQVVLGTSRGETYTIQKTGYNVPSGSSIGDRNFQIFGYNGTTNIGNVRFYNFSLWDYNNIPVRSFRPVRVGTGSTWEGALIDTLTRRIYRNAGTGAFGYGNDLKYPIPTE